MPKAFINDNFTVSTQYFSSMEVRPYSVYVYRDFTTVGLAMTRDELIGLRGAIDEVLKESTE